MSPIKISGVTVAVFLLALLPGNVMAADAFAAIAPSNTEIGNGLGNTLVLSAPPRGTLDEETLNYQPIADFLSRVVGKKVVYQHSDNWLSYTKNMTVGKYDFIYDGPHFNGWRMEKLNHSPLVRFPGDRQFVLITKSDNKAIKEVKQLAGRRICAHAPPNLGTLIMLNQFDNPARQPLIVEVKGWETSYKELINGKCVATVIPLKFKEKLDNKDKNLTQVLYTSKAVPEEALSAGPRLSPEMQAKLKQALLSEEGKAATAKLRSAYAGKNFVPATREEYAGLGVYLKDTYSFY